MAQNKRWRWWRFNPMMGSLSHLHGWVRFSWNCIDATLQALPLRTISFVTKFIIILLNITCESSSPSSSIACEINISTPAVVFSAFGIIFIVYCILYIVYMMFWSQANVTSMRLWACRSPAVTYFVVVTCANIFRFGKRLLVFTQIYNCLPTYCICSYYLPHQKTGAQTSGFDPESGCWGITEKDKRWNSDFASF